MSDRRPHWDAELLDAVGRSMHAFYDRPDAMHVYAVIAAVEDWQEARWGPECWVTTVEDAKALFLHRAQTAEAQIQAVRDVCADQCFWAEYGPDAELTNAVTVESIFAALDGGDDE